MVSKVLVKTPPLQTDILSICEEASIWSRLSRGFDVHSQLSNKSCYWKHTQEDSGHRSVTHISPSRVKSKEKKVIHRASPGLAGRQWKALLMDISACFRAARFLMIPRNFSNYSLGIYSGNGKLPVLRPMKKLRRW